MSGACHGVGGVGLGWMASKTETGVIFEQLKHFDYRSNNPGLEDQPWFHPRGCMKTWLVRSELKCLKL